ncbi:MAG TPA: hypothetical protein VKY37_05890 [Brumimicrobium sp.]|nr:hypothetical protein [Brumimicrobium sp.]
MRQLILLLFTIGILNFSYGQNHQISAGAGVLSSNSVFNALSSIGKNIAGSAFNGSTLSNSKYLGDFRVTYAYSPLNWLAVGATFSYAQSSHDHIKNNVVIGHQSIDYYTIAGEAKFYYIKKEHVRLYGLLGAGATFANQEDRMTSNNQAENREFKFLNLHLSPIGVEAGAENFGGFFELGFGYRGFASIGAFLRF